MRNVLALAVLLVSSPALGSELSGFAAVHLVGGRSWVELERHEEGPRPGRSAVISDDFFHAYRRSIPGARVLGTPVRLYGPQGSCDGTLGRPATLGLYYGDEGFGGDPLWLKAAPVRGCSGEGYSLAVQRVGGRASLARDVTDTRSVPVLLALASARAALTGSPDWMRARGEWLKTYTDEPVTSTDRVLAVGDVLYAIAEDSIAGECSSVHHSRVVVRRTPDGATTRMYLSIGEYDTIHLLGDLDGDGELEAVIAGDAGSLSVTRVNDVDAFDDADLWSTDGVPFFGCRC